MVLVPSVQPTQIPSIAGKAAWLLEYTPFDFEERFVIQIY